MSNNVPEAGFSFLGYLVKESTIRLSGKPIGENVRIGISPDGRLSDDKSLFDLTLDVIVEDEEKNLVVEMTILGNFECFADDQVLLGSFMCINAPAILFPYIRSYVSNLTALSGTAPIILPTLNMEGVGNELRKKIGL